MNLAWPMSIVAMVFIGIIVGGLVATLGREVAGRKRPLGPRQARNNQVIARSSPYCNG